MFARVFVLFVVLVLGTSVAAFAQTSGTEEGHWIAALPAPQTIEVAGGATIQKYDSYQQGHVGDGSGPTINRGADCSGMLMVASDGRVLSGSGHCLSVSADGSSGVTWSWRVDIAGVEGCPMMCGGYEFIQGFGEYEGITGGGTWEQTVAAPNGVAMGTLQGSYWID